MKDGNVSLLPTAIGTYTTDNVNTTEYAESQKELEEIVPALINLHMLPEAKKIMQFYIEKSQDGVEPIADSYSLKTGEAVLYNAVVQNAAPAPRTATSQIAYINDLLLLSGATNDHSYNTIAETALDHLLADNNQTRHNSPQTKLENILGGIT